MSTQTDRITYHLRQARRQLEWARREGPRRVVRELDASPWRRSRTAMAKWRYRRTAKHAPLARPAFVVGLQRSGTTILIRSLGASPEVELHNEADGRVFDQFRLRPDDVIRRTVVQSDHKVVLFKPLCDSHRIAHLLDDLGTPTEGRALWMFRSPAGRVRSSLGKFGAHNLAVLSEIAQGTGLNRWQAGGLTAESLDLIRSFDYSTMSPASAAALFWFVRNRLVFDLGLDERSDVMLVHYDQLLHQAADVMPRICSFLDIDYRTSMHTRFDASIPAVEMPSQVDPEIARRCSQLDAALIELCGSKLAAVGAGPAPTAG